MLYAEANVRWLSDIKNWAENVSLFVVFVLLACFMTLSSFVDCYGTVSETWRDTVRTRRKRWPQRTRYPCLQYLR